MDKSAINDLAFCVSSGSPGVALYPVYCLINHACFNNTNYVKFPDLRLELRAQLPIRKGEEVFTRYISSTIGECDTRDKIYLSYPGVHRARLAKCRKHEKLFCCRQFPAAHGHPKVLVLRLLVPALRGPLRVGHLHVRHPLQRLQGRIPAPQELARPQVCLLYQTTNSFKSKLISRSITSKTIYISTVYYILMHHRQPAAIKHNLLQNYFIISQWCGSGKLVYAFL